MAIKDATTRIRTILQPTTQSTNKANKTNGSKEQWRQTHNTLRKKNGRTQGNKISNNIGTFTRRLQTLSKIQNMRNLITLGPFTIQHLKHGFAHTLTQHTQTTQWMSINMDHRLCPTKVDAVNHRCICRSGLGRISKHWVLTRPSHTKQPNQHTQTTPPRETSHFQKSSQADLRASYPVFFGQMWSKDVCVRNFRVAGIWNAKWSKSSIK